MRHSRFPVSCIVAAAAAVFPGGMPPAVAAVALPIESVEEAVQPEAVALGRDIEFQEVVVGPGGVLAEGDGGVAGDDGRLIYSNTLGIHSTYFPTNQPVSDDIATTAPDGCDLRSFKFKVLGKVMATDYCFGGANANQPCTIAADCPGGTCPIPAPGTPYTLTYGLYTNCPLAVGNTNAQRDLVKIPGTDGMITFPDDAPRMIKHVVDPDNPLPIPSNVYLGLRFNRANCGTVIGAPAMVGFSADVFDHPYFRCNTFLGGFPQLPHASFWLEMYGDASCPTSFPGYKVAQPSGGVATICANVQGVDDVKLQVEDCQMVGYEVVVRGVGFYTFDLRRQCDGQIIPGTVKTFQVFASTDPKLQVARFTFDPPIPLLDDDVFLGFKCSSNSAGAVIAGIQPWIGESALEFFKVTSEGCEPVNPTAGVHGAVNLAITCAGDLPVGACCDMAILECKGGPDAGKRCPCQKACQGGAYAGWCCGEDSHCALSGQPAGTCEPSCAAPGTCEPVCRELPEMNCPWPPRLQELNPAWVEGGQCEPDPFELPCGVAACCKPDDTCENLTKNECEAVPPLDRPKLWQAGQYCGDEYQHCPFNACLGRQGDCTVVHDGVGCSEPFCCTDVCTQDPWCCHVEWDRRCVEQANESCPGSPYNNICLPFPPNGVGGAAELTHNAPYFGSNLYATESLDDQGFCCHSGTGLCTGEQVGGALCLLDADCPGGTCSAVVPVPGQKGYGTVWFKFVATHESAEISTCASELDGDTLVNVYNGHHTVPCAILQLIGCGDDGGCPYDNESYTSPHSRFCVGGLTPGENYYVMLASKLEQRKGIYQIEIRFPCQYLTPFPSSDCNDNGAIDGCDLVDHTSGDCNADSVPDECEIADGLEQDCNENAVPDSCEIADGESLDCDADTVPDECEGHGDSISFCDCNGDGVPDEETMSWQTLNGDPDGAYFGYQVDFHGGHLLAFEYFEKNAIFVPSFVMYARRGSEWMFEDRFFLPIELSANGWIPAVALNETSAFVGVSSFDKKAGLDDDAVYVFRHESKGWKYVEKLVAPDAATYRDFGSQLSAHGECLAVTAQSTTTPQDSEGRVFIFCQGADGLILEAELQSPEAPGRVNSFGAAIGLHGNTLAVGDTGYNDYQQQEFRAPAVFLFRKHASNWVLEARVVHPALGTTAGFGHTLDVRNNVLVVIGAASFRTNSYPNSGYVFVRQGGEWIFEDELVDPNGERHSFQGTAAIVNDGMVVLGPTDCNSLDASGHVYYRRPNRKWEYAQTLPSPSRPTGGCFSSQVLGERDVILAAQTRSDGASRGTSLGAVYSFGLPRVDCDSNGTWDACEIREQREHDCDDDHYLDACSARPFGDFDESGSISLRDFSELQRCIAGSGGGLAACCGMFDAEPRDGDADLVDFAAFAGAMTGP